jgi:hypothetical protein
LKMKSATSAGYIELSFDEWDWRLANGKIVIEFIQSLKDSIPLEDRSYNPDTHIWTIKDRWKYVIRELYSQYFEDPNQLDIF